MLSAVHQLISESMYNSYGAEEVIQRLPGDLVDKMKQLVAKIITVHLPEWGGQVLHSQVSLPRLQELDWRLDLKSASDSMHRMNVPTVLVQLKVRFFLWYLMQHSTFFIKPAPQDIYFKSIQWSFSQPLCTTSLTFSTLSCFF